MAFETGLEGKPWYFGLIFGLVLGGGLLFGGYKLKVVPMKEEIQRQVAELHELEAKIQQGRAAQKQLPQFREAVRELEAELDKLLRILPSRRNTPELLRRIRSLAEQGDFGFQRFTPGAIIDQEFYSEWPIAIYLTGDYHNLALFFDRVRRFRRIIDIENLIVNASPAEGGQTISASFTAKTFLYKEAPAPEPAAAGN